jgi:hypothetical protein
MNMPALNKNMIETYPRFSKLDLSHQAQVAELTGKFAPYSDFNFTSLFCWSVDDTTEVSLLNGNLVVRMPDYLDGHTVYSILGNNQIDASAGVLLETVDRLHFVPADTVQALAQPLDYVVTDEPDNFDYIYDLAHLSELPGAKFKKKRNKHNVFVSDHEHYELEVKTVDTLDHAHADIIKQVDRHWATLSSREMGDILPERKALDRLLDNFSAFRLFVTEVWVDGEIKAFSINEILDQDYAICHFEKALKTHHEHINTFLVIEVAKSLRAVGCKWVNWEQDLGLEGLRRSKLSYNPAKMLKKYAVSRPA